VLGATTDPCDFLFVAVVLGDEVDDGEGED
jgi:hypothetical protein